MSEPVEAPGIETRDGECAAEVLAEIGHSGRQSRPLIWVQSLVALRRIRNSTMVESDSGIDRAPICAAVCGLRGGHGRLEGEAGGSAVYRPRPPST